MITGDAFIGAQIINRDNSESSVLNLGLVIDSTGCAKRTAHFSDSRGFGVPPEEQCHFFSRFETLIPPGTRPGDGGTRIALIYMPTVICMTDRA